MAARSALEGSGTATKGGKAAVLPPVRLRSPSMPAKTPQRVLFPFYYATVILAATPPNHPPRFFREPIQSALLKTSVR
jgi:hypothetical protein